MPNKTSKSVKDIMKKKPKLSKRHTITEEEHLVTEITFSKNAISGKHDSLDGFFMEQVERLTKRLKEMRKK